MRVDIGESAALEVDTWNCGGAVPFLLVHGLASNRRTWKGVAAR